jgi:tRNA(Arg) A34 adenosine deaminase TadA
VTIPWHDRQSLALREARNAYAAGEAPVGAVVAREGRIISRAWNHDC